MKQEIEHKYLVREELWNTLEKPAGIRIKQGYLTHQPELTVRVRIKGDRGFLTLKGPSHNASRLEYEYTIPLNDAEDLLASFTHRCIDKIRYEIMHAGKCWEVDEFLGDNRGLLLAEIELEDPAESYSLPPWVENNVTEDPRYYNSYLAEHPFSLWI
jgi:adenylate cyclase